ncbi:MAG: TolC family protein, partial [Candidatus Eremiobacterota bacterium]
MAGTLLVLGLATPGAGQEVDREVPLPPAPEASARQPVTLTLPDARRLALAHHPTLRAALARSEQSREQVEIVASPARPQLNLTGSLAHQQQAAGPPVEATFPSLAPGIPPVTQEFQPQAITYSSGQVELTVRQLLFDGGRIEASLEEARKLGDQANAALVATSHQVDLNVQLAYLDALEARARQQVARDSLELAREQQRSAQARFEGGVAPRADT